jgi:oxygen-dependent protoporphyrinogen oxidase
MKAIVVGGGLAGISAALALTDSGHDVTLLEHEAQLGGNARSEVNAGRVLELGPNSFAGHHDDLWHLLERLQLAPVRLGEKTRVRYLVQRGRLRALTPSPLSILRLLPLRALPRIVGERHVPPAKPKDDESVYDFLARRFGVRAAEALASALVMGIYAGDPRVLSLQACFPTLSRWEHDHGSILRALPHAKPTRAGIFTVKGGLGRIGVAAQGMLNARCGVRVTRIGKGEVHVGTEVLRADAVIVATPATVAATLCTETTLSSALAAFTYAPLTVVHWRGDAHLPHGFGYIAPEQESLFALGTIFASDLLGEPERRFASLVGGTIHSERAAMSDADLLRGINGDLHALTHGRASEILRVQRWTDGVAQPLIGHKQRVARAHAEAARAGVVLAGAYLGGGAMHDAVKSGTAAAARFARQQVRAHAS